MHIENLATATLPCFVEYDRACTFKIGNRNDETITIPEQDCQAMETELACSGRLEMKVSRFLDISRADAVVRPLE